MAGQGQPGQTVYHGSQPTNTMPEQNFYLAVTKHMAFVNNALQCQGEMVSDLKSQVTSVQGNQNDLFTKFSQLERRYNELYSYTRYLEDYCLEIDVNSRKSHVILTGVNEDETESTNENNFSPVAFNKAVDLLSSICDTVTPADLEAVYRIGKQGKNPRPILIKFVRESVRNEVMRKKKLLKDSDETKKLFMNEDLPPVINKRRADMRAVVDNARRKNIPASMMGNRMSVNDITYEFKDIHSLPPGLKLADAKLQAVKGGFAFQSEYAYLSNFFPCEIRFKDMVFGSSEQLYQYERACFANDAYCMNDILAATTPQAAKRAGYRVGNSPGWDRVKIDKMAEIVALKFNQNPVLKNEILKTGEANLIEASHDTFWGAGFTLNAKKLREGNWHGHNHLGKILVNYRFEVRRSLPPPPAPNMSQCQYSNAPAVSQVNTQATTQSSVTAPSHMYTEQPPHSTHAFRSSSMNTVSHSYGNSPYVLPASQVYSAHYSNTSSQCPPPTIHQAVTTSPAAFSSASDSYSNYGERRMEYDPGMSPHFHSQR